MAFSRSWILGDDILGEEFCVSPQQVFVAVRAFQVGFELSFVAMVDVRAYVTQSILVQAGSSIVNT